ncbi:MAG: hemin-degrading factor, partial [Gemmatimonadota bacterium]
PTPGATSRRIEADVERILPGLVALGPLMALTRNDLFVHEKTGVYGEVYVNPHVSSVVGEEIDLRIFPARWKHGFAVETEGRGSRRRSFQFFDAEGVAVHKIFLTEESDVEAYEALVDELLHPDQSPALEVDDEDESEIGHPEADGDDGAERDEGATHQEKVATTREVDVAALEADWRAMKDTHDFHGLLREHGVARTRALRLVSDELARPASNDGVRRILETASREGIEIMVFVQSPGTIQIHHGPVSRIVDTPPWLNVLDGDFDLHVLEEGIAATWVVRKPVETGWVTSVEVYDAADTLCALFFGYRKEGQPEDPAWRDLAEGLE